MHLGEIVVDSDDFLWMRICILLLQYPPKFMKSQLRSVVHFMTHKYFDIKNLDQLGEKALLTAKFLLLVHFKLEALKEEHFKTLVTYVEISSYKDLKC